MVEYTVPILFSLTRMFVDACDRFNLNPIYLIDCLVFSPFCSHCSFWNVYDCIFYNKSNWLQIEAVQRSDNGISDPGRCKLTQERLLLIHEGIDFRFPPLFLLCLWGGFAITFSVFASHNSSRADWLGVFFFFFANLSLGGSGSERTVCLHSLFQIILSLPNLIPSGSLQNMSGAWT